MESKIHSGVLLGGQAETETKQTVKKRNNRRTVQQQVEVTPRPCGTTQALLSVSALRTRVNMSPLCHEQSLVSGENLVFCSCYSRMKRSCGVQRPKRKCHRTPHPHQCAVQRVGPLRICIYFLFRVTLTRREYNITI